MWRFRSALGDRDSRAPRRQTCAGCRVRMSRRRKRNVSGTHGQVTRSFATALHAHAARRAFRRRTIWPTQMATLICGVAGSVVTPVIYALHPPYKAMGARIGFAVWTPVIFIAVVMSGLTLFISQLFPWPILAAMIAYVSIGVGTATLRRAPPRRRSELSGRRVYLPHPASQVLCSYAAHRGYRLAPR